jgi:hypothetical protein
LEIRVIFGNEDHKEKSFWQTPNMRKKGNELIKMEGQWQSENQISQAGIFSKPSTF